MSTPPETPVTVVELSSFLRTAAGASMADEERAALVDYLARNPEAGAVIQGTGGLRKLRWARPGSGKSGGYRAIYYYHDMAAPIYAVAAYAKGQQEDLTPSQKAAYAGLVEALKMAIRTNRKEKT